MSKFSSYDDLPFEVAYKLECLEHELQEGDITQKEGKNNSSSPQQRIIEENNNEEPSTPIDFGSEPSAADVVDFLDFLPSPTHSPVDNKGASLMKENHIKQTPKVETNNNSSSLSPTLRQMSAPPPPLLNRPPQLPPQQFRPPPNFSSDNFSRSPVQLQQQNWSQGSPRPVDPRMGPPRPIYGNGYPMRPPMMNGFRPPPPPPPSSSSLNPSIYNRPPPQSYNAFRPPPSIKGPPIPTHTNTPFSQQHSKSPSLDSKPEYGIPLGVRQSLDVVTAPESNDWETSSTSWRSNIGREPSIMSAPGRIRPSMSTGSALSNSTMDSNFAIRRTPSSTSRGRSRYRDSYMATTFKAIEPAPQPRLSLNDTRDQMFLSDLAGRQMTPLKGRPISFPIVDSDKKTILTDFNSLADVLRFRSTTSADRMKNAFVLVDTRGKESASLTWEKLNARAEKIAHQLKEKGKINSGDRVALIYRKSEVLEFIPAFFGCFLAGVTAIPINAAEDLSELSFILNLTNISLILTTDHNHRAFTKDMQAKSMEFPANIIWWKTNDMGTWYPSKKLPDYPVIKVPEIAYIEYAKASNGELKGVTVTHTSIMEQCAAFQASTTDTNVIVNDGDVKVEPKRKGCLPETLVSYFEPRQQIGLVLSVLQSVYTGYFTIFASGSIIDTPAVWIYVLSKYKATMALIDYPALKFVTKYYQANVKEVSSHSKKITPDLSSLRNMIVDTNTINPELNEYVADKLLRPLGNTDNPLEVVRPVLSLPEQGGKILSMRDNLGPVSMEEYVEREEQQEDGRPAMTTQSVLAPGNSHDIFECLFDAEALKANKVLVLAAGAEARKAENINMPGRIRVESFGFCMPKTTVAIVDPDTATICPPDTLGEVWINSPSIATGFWALPKHTDSIFHARAIVVPSERSYPEVYGESFLRTGLSGTTIGGRLFILGSYEERVRQQRLGADFGMEDTYYANELLFTVNKRARIEKCTVFEVLIKGQHLPIIICESTQSKSELSKKATEIDDVLIEFHGIRMYAIIFVAENGLPRQLVHGRRTIHQLLTKRYFLQGQLNIRYLKMDVNHTIFNLAANEDPSRDLWLSRMAYDKAIRTGAIIPHRQHQHTGMEKVLAVLDDRTEYDISRFTNIVDILQWRTTLNPEEVAYTVSSLSGSNINTKSYTWRKLSYMSATVAAHLAKKGVKQRQKVIVMMPFGIEYIFCVYACLVIGVVPIPIEPIDPQQQSQRITDFSKQMVEVSKDLSISAILTNAAGDDIMRHNAVKAAIKLNIAPKSKLPEVINISKAPKHHKTLGKESGYMMRPEWISGDRNSPSIILVQNSSDGRRVYIYLGHNTILNQCRTQKMTCQMRSQRGIVTTGLGTYEGLGFLYAVFCGVYVGCSTVLIPSADFYLNPASFFESLQRYKTKDAFLTNALIQFAMNRMNANDSRHITLKGVQNLMLANDSRPRPLLYQHVARYFARQRLEKEAINTVYCHIGNPTISTRSYMLMEPISLSIDPYWLRQGIIRAMSPEEEPYGILLHDSGIVPCNTMVAIVNPETGMVCPSNVLGEIWVSSDSNAMTFHDLDESTHNFRFEATIAGSDQSVKYMRTGDFGFLWNVRRRVDNRMMHPILEEGQCLYVLGPISETIVRNGLIHFPVDIELSMERSHPAIPSGGSIAFQFKDEVVAVVSIKSSEYALSIVPLVVNAVLDNHSFLIDTVVIVHPNHFPRSKFGDKVRRKAMTSYVEKKLTAIYVKRITNQNESLSLPQWTQSQLSLSDINLNSDDISIHTIPHMQSSSDFHSEYDKSSIVQQLVRQDTGASRGSLTNESSIQSPR